MYGYLGEPLYLCGKIHIRLICAAALTIVLQKTTLLRPAEFSAFFLSNEVANAFRAIVSGTSI